MDHILKILHLRYLVFFVLFLALLSNNYLYSQDKKDIGLYKQNARIKYILRIDSAELLPVKTLIEIDSGFSDSIRSYSMTDSHILINSAKINFQSHLKENNYREIEFDFKKHENFEDFRLVFDTLRIYNDTLRPGLRYADMMVQGYNKDNELILKGLLKNVPNLRYYSNFVLVYELKLKGARMYLVTLDFIGLFDFESDQYDLFRYSLSSVILD